jgi:hypothetical protein
MINFEEATFNLVMKKFANYMILPEFRLILECCKGQASVEDAINMKKDELSDTLYNPDYNIIVDFQEFETILDAKTTESILNFFNFLKGLDIKSRIAFLTTEPHQVVISMILKGLSNDFAAFNIEVFSTFEAAITFLGFPFENLDLINNKIMELNKNTA